MSSKPQFVGERVKLGAIVRASSERNKGGRCDSVYSVTNSQGFIPSEEYFSKEVFSKDLDTYRVVKRDMIAYNPSRINVGSVALQDKSDEVVVSPLYVVFSVDESKVTPGYVVRFLKSKPGLDQIVFQSIGTVRNNLKYKALCQMELTLPSLSMQRDRLANLVSIESRISQSRKVIEELDSLVKSRFVEMFGDPVDGALWAKQKLSDLYQVKSSKRIYAREQTKSGVPFLRLADVSSLIDSGMADSGLFISEERFEELEARGQVPAPDDVLVTARGTLGRCYVIKPADHFYFQDGMITWLSTGENSPLPSYLLAIFDNPHFIEQLSNNCSGTTVKYLSISDLANVTIPVAPLALQRQFAAFVAQVDKSRFAGQLSVLRLTRYG